MRSIFEPWQLVQPLTQGSIISGCKAEGYEDCEVYGLIITPRCDLAHEGKVKTVHYLPIVDIKDWIYREYYIVEREKNRENERQELSKMFEKAGLGSDLVSYSSLSKEDFVKIIEDNFTKDKRNLAHGHLSFIFDVDDKEYKAKLQAEGKLPSSVKNDIGRLVHDQIHNVYLIESWDPNKDAKIILLREIYHLTYALATKMSSGIEEKTLKSEDFSNNDLKESETRSSIYYVEAVVKSPFIEHIMQAFSYNFFRIGVEDRELDKTYLNDLTYQQFIR